MTGKMTQTENEKLPLRVSDSTRLGEWFKCPQKRWWLTEANDRGIVPDSEKEDLTFGLALHDEVEALVKGLLPGSGLKRWWESPNERLTIGGHSAKVEGEWLIRGLLEVFRQVTWPVMQGEFELLDTEMELTLPLSPWLWWMSRPDMILKRKTDGLLFNINIKTTSWMKDLEKGLELSPQLMMEAECIRQAFDKECSGSYILAFSKGAKQNPLACDKDRGHTEGFRRDSPFTWRWTKGGKVLERFSPGAEKTPTWYLWKTFEDMIKGMNLLTVAGEVQLMGPILTSPEHMESLKKDILDVERMALTGPWPRNRSNCLNDGGFKRHCGYSPLCWGTEAEGEGLFSPREFNHPIEETIWNRENKE